jgi:uncharacterized protein YozE (UPF0346 family)
MNTFTFQSPVGDREFYDFATLATKHEFNKSVSSIKSLLCKNGVHCKTSSLNEWLSQSIGFNSAAHLLSELPIAFCAMEAIYELNKLLNNNTPNAILFESLIYRYPDEDAEEKWGGAYDFLQQIMKDVAVKLNGTTYKQIKISNDLDLFWPHWNETPTGDWQAYHRASAITEFFPAYSKLDRVCNITFEKYFNFEDALWQANEKRGKVLLMDVFLTLYNDDFLNIEIKDIESRECEFLASYIRDRSRGLGYQTDDGDFFERHAAGFTKQGFYPWLMKQTHRNDAISDLAGDVKNDPSFPKKSDALAELSDHLLSKGAIWDAQQALEDAWELFSGVRI